MTIREHELLFLCVTMAYKEWGREMAIQTMIVEQSV